MSFYQIEESADIDVHLNSVPSWMSRVALPILIAIIIGLPVVLAFIPYSEVETVKIKIIPLQKTIVVGDNYFLEESIRKALEFKKGEFLALDKSGDSLKAPFDGKLCLNFDSNNVGSIPVLVPAKIDFVIRGVMPTRMLNFVKVGQKIEIDLDTFPANEFGYLEGRVGGISEQPNDQNEYVFDININNALLTSKGFRIEPQWTIIGRGKVFIQEQSILNRILNSSTKI